MGMIILPKGIYRLNAVPSKSIPYSSQKQKKETILKFMWDTKDSGQPNHPEKEKNAEGITIPDLQLYYRAIGGKKLLGTKSNIQINGTE